MSTPFPVVCLMGPTASGKTALSLEIAKHFPCEIISVDSVMVYRGLDIGTAKPGADMLTSVPHHLIDIRDPSCPYSVGEFLNDALQSICDIHARGRIPLLVGGTMLYFRALQQGLAALPKADQDLRQHWQRRLENEGVAALYAELVSLDPAAAARIQPQDKQRIQRALEVFTLTGKSITQWQQENSPLPDAYRFCFFAMAPDTRTILHEQIALRFKQMLELGLIEEVKRLYHRGDLRSDLPAIRAVGYRQVWAYLAGEISYDSMVEQGIVATRQLAKRQLTWLRSWPELTWLMGEPSAKMNEISRALKE